MPKAKYSQCSNRTQYKTSITIGFDNNGKRITKSIYGKSSADLERKVHEYRLYLEENPYDAVKHNFKEYATKWCDTKSIGVEKATHKMYKTVIDFNLSDLHEKELKDIARQDVQDVINKHVQKARTCQKIKITINQILKQAKKDGLIKDNFADDLVIPKYTAETKRPLMPHEAKLSVLTTFSDRESCYIRMIKNCGLRREEALALQKSCFNFEKNTVTISKAIHFDKNQATIKDPKSKASKRTLPLLKSDIDFLKAYLDNLNTPYLFTSLQSKELISEQSFKRMFESIIDKMNAKATTEKLPQVGDDLTSHIFRHDYATALYYAGIGVKEAQYLLGHSSVRITLEIYTHLDSLANHEEISNKLEDYNKTRM